MSRIAFAAVFLAAPVLWPPLSRADDSPAVVELKAGYALKQQGDCRAALPHFEASYRASPTAKSVLNEADCEAKLGQLVDAKSHASEGRELARKATDADLMGIGEELLASIEKRLAHLTITLAPGAPTDCIVLRDGTQLDAATVGVAVEADPGRHQVVIRTPGRQDRAYDVELSEGQSRDLVIEPGARTPATALPDNPYGQSAHAEAPHVEAAAGSPFWTPRREVAAILVGVGALGLVVGGAFGISAISNNSASNSNGHCDSTGCDPTGAQLRNTALGDATISTILVGVGLAAVGGGIALYLTAPKSSASTASVRVAPLVSRSSAGLGLRGAW